MRLAVVVLLSLLACAAPRAENTDITFESRDARLTGLLRTPSGRGRHPAVVLVHGSGQVTADQIMRSPAGRLVAAGFAVFAYDKRGVGRSTGEYTSIGPGNSERMFDLLAADAIAAVDTLRGRRDIDPARIGLLGFSQAGWIAPLAASRSRAIKFVAIVSGPAVSVGEEIAYSRLAGEDPGSLQGVDDVEIERRMRAFTGPHGYTPEPVLRALRTPSLWVLGEKDRSIPLKRTVEILEVIRKTGRPITLHVVPGVNHGLRNTLTGEQPDVWPPIIEWLKDRTESR